jgi:hypothetical protein
MVRLEICEKVNAGYKAISDSTTSAVEYPRFGAPLHTVNLSSTVPRFESDCIYRLQSRGDYSYDDSNPESASSMCKDQLKLISTFGRTLLSNVNRVSKRICLLGKKRSLHVGEFDECHPTILKHMRGYNQDFLKRRVAVKRSTWYETHVQDSETLCTSSVAGTLSKVNYKDISKRRVILDRNEPRFRVRGTKQGVLEPVARNTLSKFFVHEINTSHISEDVRKCKSSVESEVVYEAVEKIVSARFRAAQQSADSELDRLRKVLMQPSHETVSEQLTATKSELKKLSGPRQCIGKAKIAKRQELMAKEAELTSLLGSLASPSVAHESSADPNRQKALVDIAPFQLPRVINTSIETKNEKTGEVITVIVSAVLWYLDENFHCSDLTKHPNFSGYVRACEFVQLQTCNIHYGFRRQLVGQMFSSLDSMYRMIESSKPLERHATCRDVCEYQKQMNAYAWDRWQDTQTGLSLLKLAELGTGFVNPVFSPEKSLFENDVEMRDFLASQCALECTYQCLLSPETDENGRRIACKHFERAVVSQHQDQFKKYELSDNKKDIQVCSSTEADGDKSSRRSHRIGMFPLWFHAPNASSVSFMQNLFNDKILEYVRVEQGKGYPVQNSDPIFRLVYGCHYKDIFKGDILIENTQPRYPPLLSSNTSVWNAIERCYELQSIVGLAVDHLIPSEETNGMDVYRTIWKLKSEFGEDETRTFDLLSSEMSIVELQWYEQNE